jgi:hypothetical protein
MGIMKHALLACLLGGTLAVTSGCCGLFRAIQRPLDCIETAYCDAGCCGDCGSGGCGHCGAGRVARCESCESSCHDGQGCGARACRRGPLAWLFGIFEWECYPDCGCGEVYCGECHSDLPDCRDPCDCHGNWVGRSCGGCAGQGREGHCTDCARAQPASTAPVYAHQIPQPPSAPRILPESERAIGTRVISQGERVVVGPTIAPNAGWQAAQPKRAAVRR